MEKRPQYRQGDVYLKRVDTIPAGLKPVKPKNGRVILAHGEVTGHHHSFPAKVGNGRITMYGQDENAPRFIDIPHPATLVHQEHAPINVEPGTYEVIRQREYSPKEIRRVLD
jgi:hypothetical protein